tara:strand:- start:1152 stop:1307 length:156 start_codon:yes stop_codon:yes gene_type:complete
MNLYSFIAITILLSLFVAIKQKIRGLKFWSSFFISLIAIAGVLGTIWKILS